MYHQSLDSILTNWTGHCDRIKASLQSFAWEQPDWNRLRQGAETLISHFPVLRITVFPDGREWITGRLLPTNLTERQHRGITAGVVAERQFQRCLPAHKTGNYLSAWLARTTAENMLAQEAILMDESGNWLETSTGNLWGWRDGNWWTPPLTAGILPGVVRSQLASWLKHDHQPVREQPWLPELVKGFEAIAYSNSVVEVIPIHTVIQGREAGGQVKVNQMNYDPHHPGFKQLRGLFAA